jgi:hypothetical protein
MKPRPQRQGERGAAVVELGMILPMLLLLVLTAVDMGRLIYMNQLSADLTRTAAAMGARGFSAQEALAAIRAADHGLDVDSVGIVFVSTIKRRTIEDATPWIVSQVQDGAIPGFNSYVGSPGGPADLPEISTLEPGMTLTAVEVAVPFQPILSLEGIGVSLFPSVIYEVSYF